MEEKKTLRLTIQQYDGLIKALALGPKRSILISKYYDKTLDRLPFDLVVEINKIRKNEELTFETSDDLIMHLLVMDSQGRRATSLLDDLAEISHRNRDLFLESLKRVFEKSCPETKSLGKLMRSRLAIAAAITGVKEQGVINHYAKLFAKNPSYDSEEVLKRTIFAFPEVAEDLTLFMRFAKSELRSVNIFAAKNADVSILPFLAGMPDVDGRRILNERIKSLTEKRAEE